MKILVTGGAGFIGSHLVDALVDAGHKTVIFDNLDSQVHPGARPPVYLNKKAEFIRGDVLDYSSLKKATAAADAVVHLAARVGVGQSQYEIKKYVETNSVGTANLLDIIVNSARRPKKIIVAGSMSSYGEGIYLCVKCGAVKPPLRGEDRMKSREWEPACPSCGGALKPAPTSENTPLESNSIYALTKKNQEEMALIIGRTYGIPTTVLRFFNVYGPRQSLSNPYTGVAAIFMSRIKNDNRPVIYEDGLQTRDFIYVDDVVRGIIGALTSQSSSGEVFNLGSGKPVAIKSVAQTIAAIYGKKIKPDVTCDYRKGDVRHCYADISKIKARLSFKPAVNFETGMRILCDWSRKAEARDLHDKAVGEMKKRGLI